MMLMLLGNVGIITVIASLVAGLVDQGESGSSLLVRLLMLGGGIAGLWLLSRRGHHGSRRGEALDRLDERPKGEEGDRKHREGVADERREQDSQARQEARRKAGG